MTGGITLDWKRDYCSTATLADSWETTTTAYSKIRTYEQQLNMVNASSRATSTMIIQLTSIPITQNLAWLEEGAFATGGKYWRENTDATTSITAGNYYGLDWNEAFAWSNPVIAPGERMRQMIRDRMAPAIHRGRKRQSLSIAIDVREERARQTLRRIIGEQSFRKFMRDGFITVVPKSGLTYRIYPGHGITEVYDRGIMVDRLCVVLKGNFPPTDSLLMRYLLILNDEGEFSKYAIKHHVSQPSKQLVFPAQEVQPLTEAWAKLKVA